MHIHFDWETYSPEKIGDVGSYAYIANPDADIISAAWAYNREPPLFWSPLTCALHNPMLDELFQKINQGATLLAWNATFEYDVWNGKAHPKYGWPKLSKYQIIDVQAIALNLALPADLDNTAKILQLTEQKDKEGRRLMQKLSSPRRPTKNNPHTRWPYESAKADYDRYFEYNKQDVVVEREIYKKLRRFALPKAEQLLWIMTLEMNEAGIPVDVETAKAILEVLKEYESRLSDELNRITQGVVKTPGQIEVIRQFLADLGVDIPDLGKETVARYLKIVESPLARRILELRQLLGRSSTKKFEKLLAMVDSKGRIHNSLRYHNCTTGRWGSSGMQIHNLPRGDIEEPNFAVSVIRTRDLTTIGSHFPDLKKTCTSLVRPIICSEPGYRFLIVDYSAIEAIVIAWIAGEPEALRMVVSGRDIYKWYATLIYPVAYDDVTKEQRNHAKVCLLGLGYQMGVSTFLSSSEGYGINFSWEEAEASVKLYRKTFPKVVDMWYALEQCALKTIKSGVSHSHRLLEFSMEGDFLRMKLPSGRKISYPYPRIEEVETPWGAKKIGFTCWQREQKTKKWIRLPVKPGKLTENAVQATARDIMAEAKLRLKANKYNVLFSVHDEIISHDRLDFGSLDEMINIMCDTNKKLYPGLPIKAAGFVTDRYMKG